MTTWQKIVKWGIVINLIFLCSACANLGVKPWQRDILAKPEMSLADNMDLAFDDHIYFSKEATSGGRGFAGGGCGCN